MTIDLMKKLLDRLKKAAPKDKDIQRPYDIRVAACAIFLEMAHVDGEFTDSERKSILDILKRHYSLSEEHIEDLLKASNEQLDRSIDLWPFTNLINKNYSVEEKLRIIEMVWEIAYRDGKLDKYEDYLIHKLGTLLHLTHKQLIDAKLKVTQRGIKP